MHVTLLCDEYPPGEHGGVGSLTQTLGRALVARGHKITVVGVYGARRAGIEEDRGVRIVRLAHAPVRGVGFAINGVRLRSALRHIHRESPIDILEGPESSFAMVSDGFPAAKVIRMNGGHHFFAVTLGGRPRAWRQWLELRSFARADYLSAVSRFVAERTRELLRFGHTAVEILPNPVDVYRFQPRRDVPEDPGLIVFVGTLCHKKGVRQLVEAMPQIVSGVPEARLWLVGRDSRDRRTGQSYAEWLRESIPVSFRDRIVFRGAVENAELPAVLARAQVCVYPSHMEALPVAWLEGMAMGKAVVASETGPGPEVIEQGLSGLLCDPHDSTSIANNVIAVLKNASLRHRLGTQARARVVEHFSIDALVNRNEAFYRRCIEQHSRA